MSTDSTAARARAPGPRLSPKAWVVQIPSVPDLSPCFEFGVSEPRFSEDLAREILDQAASLQEAQDKSGLPAAGEFSLSDLESIAAEAGISPEHIRTAIQARTQGTGTDVALAADDPRYLVHRRTLAATVSDEEWGRIVKELREEFGVDGAATAYGELREWIGKKDGSPPVTVQIRPSDTDGTFEVEVQQDMKPLRDMYVAFPTAFGGAAILFFTMAMLDGDVAIGLPIMFAVLAAIFGVGSFTYAQHWQGKQPARFERLMNRIELIARTTE